MTRPFAAFCRVATCYVAASYLVSVFMCSEACTPVDAGHSAKFSTFGIMSRLGLFSIFFSVIISALVLPSYSETTDDPNFCFVPLSSTGEYATTVCVDRNSGAIQLKDSVDIKAVENIPMSASDADVSHVLLSAYLVFFMQMGFALVEVGSVHHKNTINILIKNFMDACIGAIVWYIWGYAFAYGVEGDGPFIGGGNFGLSDETGNTWHSWVFQWAFAATASTIVSGAMAERTTLSAYFTYTVLVTAWVYPVVVHWVWDADGWLSAFNSAPLWTKDTATSSGFIDFAGSGVVHMVGGCLALVGSWIVGPRAGRFDKNGKPVDLPRQSIAYVAMGVFCLWFGWYGFNPGSTLRISEGNSHLAGLVAVNTTIAACAAAITGLFIGYLTTKSYDLGIAMNSLLGGLVGVTASCATIKPWGALIVGIVAAVVYYFASNLMLRLKIDDPVDAIAVHGFCGFWGVLSVGILSSDARIAAAGFAASNAFSSGRQFAIQLVGAIVIIAWSLTWGLIIFSGIKHFVGIRVSEDDELKGLDLAKHGGDAYFHDFTFFNRSSKRLVSDSPESPQDLEMHKIPDAELNAQDPKDPSSL